MRLLKKIPIHPSFYLVFAWFVITGQTYLFFMLIFCLLIHEMGHYLVAKKLKYKLSSFYLAPYGVALNYKDSKFLGKDEIKIALAGPIANIIFCVLIVANWWIFPEIYFYTFQFVDLSLGLAIFNLLPAYPLDGGRVVVAFLSEKISRKKAFKIVRIINILFCLIFAVCFVVTCFVDYNPTFALMIVFLLGGMMESKMEGEYQFADIFKKKIKNFSTVKFLAVNEKTSLGELMIGIDGAKLTIFCLVLENGKTVILTEKKVLSLCMKHPITTKLNQLDF